MLGRLLSWCSPRRALESPTAESEMTDVEQALAPYRDEPARPLLRLVEPVREWPDAAEM